jgi:hypothetical protein
MSSTRKHGNAREVEKVLGAANAAVTREAWAEAERALAERFA